MRKTPLGRWLSGSARAQVKARLALLALALGTGCGSQDAVGKSQAKDASAIEAPALPPPPAPTRLERLGLAIRVHNDGPPLTPPPAIPVSPLSLEPPTESPPRDPDRAVVYSGRVVSPTGAPIHRARIWLIAYPPYFYPVSSIAAAGQRTLVDTTRTAVSGRFVVSDWRTNWGRARYLIFEADGMSRTISASQLPESSEIRLARGRKVSIELRCDQMFEEEMHRSPRVTAIWHPGDEPWTSRDLIPAGMHGSEPELPGFDVHGRGPVPLGTHRFEVEITLPVGFSTLVFSGPCGYGTREIEIPPDERRIAPVSVALPRPDAGSFEFHIIGARQNVSPERPAQPHFAELWSGNYFRRRVSMFPLEPVLIRGIPSGEYRVGVRDGPRCQRALELRPGSLQRVELDSRSCLVGQMAGVL